jgi:hypothetical protein
VLSQQDGVAEGSPIREMPGRVEAALTKPGHASTARWCGFGERDGEEYERTSVTGSLDLDPPISLSKWVDGSASPTAG